MIPFITLIASFTCYYTAVVMFRHLGSDYTINKMILSHFKYDGFCYFYNITMFLSFIGEILLYFDLLVSETQGILYFLEENIKVYFPYYVAVFLIVLCLVCRYFHFEN
jgi:hypothetical protein